MTGFLSWLLDASVIVFAVASMLSVGFGHTVLEILGPLRNLRGVVRALLANFVLVPALALLVLRVLPLPEPHATGIFLIATAAGAPFLIKLAQAADSDVALSATLLVVLLPATIVYMPLVVPLALPDAQVGTLAIAVPLVVTMLLPLAAGLLVRTRADRWAKHLQPGASSVATLSLVVLILSLIATNLSGIPDVLFTPSIVAALLVISGAFLIGYLLGMDRPSREVLGLGTSQRNIAAATVVATQAVDNPDTVVMVIVASLAGFAILFPVAAWLRRRSGGAR
jgi:predicted Na+-dependent transporter